MQCIQPGSWFHYFCPVNTFMWVLLFMVKDRHTLLKALHKYIDKWREYIGRMGCRRIKDCSKRFLKPMNDTKYPSLSTSLYLSFCMPFALLFHNVCFQHNTIQEYITFCCCISFIQSNVTYWRERNWNCHDGPFTFCNYFKMLLLDVSFVVADRSL